jgi:tRNA(fMet)-specific endonuclease VapC
VPDDLLLDTDVVIDLLRAGGEGERWRRAVQGHRLVISFVTVAELWSGAYRRNWGERRRRDLRTRIETLIPIASTDELAEEWAHVVDDGARLGHPLGVTEKEKAHHAHDAWIAATARMYDLPLLTGNRRHFDGLPRLRLIAAVGEDE